MGRWQNSPDTCRTRDEVDRDIARQAKVCTECGELKPFDEFYAMPRNRDGRHSKCSQCTLAKHFPPEKQRERRLRRAYGISTEEYEALLSLQGGGCAICGRKENPDGKSLPVDHCHGTGKIRGILCSLCNSAIGSLGDDPERTRAAADYLENGI